MCADISGDMLSCAHRCNETYIPGKPCYCNTLCDQYENCCFDYYDQCARKIHLLCTCLLEKPHLTLTFDLLTVNIDIQLLLTILLRRFLHVCCNFYMISCRSVERLSLIHISEPRDGLLSRMPSSA